MRVQPYIAGISAACALAVLAPQCSLADGTIITDDFSTSTIDYVRVRVMESDIDDGWQANSDAQAGQGYPQSAWTIAGGTLSNASAANNSEGEGGVAQVITVAEDGSDLVVSFDYTNTGDDTLYVYLWGYTGVLSGDDDLLGNYQASNGAYHNNGEDVDGPGNVDTFSLKDGSNPAVGSRPNALVALTGSGHYSISIKIADLGIAGVDSVADFSYLHLVFTRNLGVGPGTTGIDNLLIEADTPPVTQVLQKRNYSYLYYENGFPTQFSGRRPQSDANLAARANPDLVFQTGYYSLMFDGNDVELKGYDALAGSDYRTALDEDVTVFTPASSLLLRAYRDGVAYDCTQAVVVDSNGAYVRLVESGQYVQRIDHHGLEFRSATGALLVAEGRLEISAWPDRVTFLLDFSDEIFNPITRTTIEVVSPLANTHLADAMDDQVRLTLSPHEDAKLGVMSASSHITEATNLQNGSPLTVSFDEDVHAFNINVPAGSISYPADIGRLDEYLIEVTNDTFGTKNIPLVFEQPIPRNITGTVMLLCDETDGRPLGIPVQISKNWHRDSNNPTVHEGPWLRGSTLLALEPGESRRFKLRVVYGYWGGAGAVSHAQLSLVGWGGNNNNWQWHESALGAWGESITYDPSQHAGGAFMGDIRPTFTDSYSGGGPLYNWTENCGGGDFLIYRDSANTYRWVKRMKTCFLSTGPNLTEVFYSGVTDDDKIRLTYTSRAVSTLDYHRRFHDYKYEFLQDVVSPQRLVFHQMAADYYHTAAYTDYYLGDEAGLITAAVIDAGGNTYKGSPIPFNGKWLSIDDTVGGGNPAKALRGLMPLSSTLNGNPMPIYLHKYGRTWGTPTMLFDLSGSTVSDSYTSGDVVEGSLEFVMPPQHVNNYWGSDAELINRLTAYGDTAWEPVHDEFAHNVQLNLNMHLGTLLQNYPVEIEPTTNSSVLADFTISGGGLGHVPVSLKGAASDQELRVQRWTGGNWTNLESVNIADNSFYQGRQNPDGSMDYVFSIPRPSFDLTEAWRVRIVTTDPAAGSLPPAFVAAQIIEINAMEDSPYSSTLADDAFDPEFDPMTFSKISGPAWLVVAADGTLSGTPGAGDVGTNVFSVQVSAIGGSDTALLSILVEAANQPPAFLSDPIQETNGSESSPYSSTLADDASDPESDPTTFSKISGPAWLSVASDGTLSGTPAPVDVGTNSFSVQVNALGGSDTATLNIVVDPDALASVQALGGLTAAPTIYVDDTSGTTTSVSPGEMKAIFFDGLDYLGSPTRVYAYVSLPAGASAANPVPGVVLVHGGGGTAFDHWVALWTNRGYAAISIAVEGQTDATDPPTISTGWHKHNAAGPERVGIYGDSNVTPISDQWMYHAVADTVLANSLLRSLPEVSQDDVGLMGISWGGIIASTVIGIDTRFDFAIPTYGCGNLDEALNFYGTALSGNTLYTDAWDPMVHLPNATMPVLWFSWPEDIHFGLDSLADSYSAAPGPHMVSLVPGMGHGHGPPQNRPESYAFADSIVSNGTPWCLQQSASLSNGQAEVTFLSSKILDQASLVSTLEGGFTGDRIWTETAATLVNNGGGSYTLSAALPEFATAWFINGLSGTLVASSDYQETGVAPPASVIYDVTANWSSKTVNGNDHVTITSGATVTLDQDDTALTLLVDEGTLQVDQNHSLSLNGELTVNANGTVTLNNGTLSPVGAATTLDGTMTLNGGIYTRDIAGVASVGHNFYGGGILKVQSGLLSLINGAATDIIRLNTDVEISGGTLDLSGQIYVGSSWTTNDFTVIGDVATINMVRLNQVPASHAGRFNFILDETGVSTINLAGWVHLQNATITVDGSAYTGGPANILLFDSANLATLADPANITVTGFAAQGLTASVIQDDTNGKDWVQLVIQTINQPPAFTADPINEVSAMEDLAYNSTLSDDASDPDSDPMTFTKVSGPAWLSVAADGTLSGTPGAGDVGGNVFTVQVDAAGGSDTATLNITVEEFLVADSANSETPVQGTVSGSIENTFVNDDVYEVVTEVLDATPTSLLEHQWTFDVFGAELVTFYVEAHHSANTEGDDIIFAYSTNGVDWVDMVTVVKTADDNTAQFYALPSGLSGTVYVRAVDADHSVNNTLLDSLYVDALFIVSEYPSVVPTPATAPSPAHAAVDVSLSSILSWSGGTQASSHDVYFGVTPTPGAGEFQTNQPGTSFTPSMLNYSTTYYWAIDEVNSLGTTAGPTWSFTTVADVPQWTELTYDDFESGWGSWLDGGSDALLSSVNAIDTTCMNLQDDSSTSDSELSTSLDLTGYTSLKIEFSYVVASFENAEDFWVRFSDNGGASWTTVKAYVNNVDFIDNGTRYNPELILESGSYNFTSNVKIQFVCNASGNQDDVYIDNIRISALASSGPPDPASAPFPASGSTNVPVSAQLDWTAGAGANSHDVYFGTSPSPAYQGSQAGTGFDPGLLDMNTTYYWAVDEVNSYGAAAGPVWSFTTMGSAPSWTELTYDDFESGWGNWLDGGSDALLSSVNAIDTTCMNLQDNSSTSEAELAGSFDLTGYSQLKIEFSYVVRSFEGSEDFWVRYSSNGGSTWTTVKAFVNNVDFIDNGTRYDPEIIIDGGSYTFNNNVKIMFECDASGNGDDVYIDNIRISAQ